MIKAHIYVSEPVRTMIVIEITQLDINS